MGTRLKRVWRGVASTVTSLFLAFVVLELTLTLGLESLADSANYDRYASFEGLNRKYGEGWIGTKTRYAPHRYLGYYPKPGYSVANGDKHNSLGYRGEEVVVPKPEGKFRIAFLGGSTTYGFGVPHYRGSFPFQLQEVLHERGHTDVESVNAGASSYSTWESLINLSLRVLDLEADLIVVYHGTNDAALRMVWPASAYLGDNSGAKGPWLGSVEGRSSFFETSTLLRIVGLQLGWTAPHTDLASQWDRRADTFYSPSFEGQQVHGRYPQGVFERVDAETMMAANPPIYFERNLQSMIGLADAHGVQLILTTFASSPLFTENPRVAHAVYRSAMDEGNEIMRTVSERSSARLYDFAAEMPPDRKFYTDGRHFTREGNALRASLFADYLVRNGMLP